MAREIRYDNAGTVEFLYDLDRHEWFFIEMNPRIQVEHTVTEVITGLDLVRAQILIAQGHALHSRGGRHAARRTRLPRNGYAIQCRITTEDPENKFTPDYGKILAYRSPGGFGIRLDGGMGYSGAVITPFYDSLLVKVIASGQTFDIALDRMHRALSRVPHPRREDQHPVPRERDRASDCSAAGQATTTLIDTTPELFALQAAPRPRHEAAQLPRQRHRERQPARQGLPPGRPFCRRPRRRAYDHRRRRRRARASCCSSSGPKKFAEWTRKQKRLLVTDTTFRDAHQSLMATRVRTFDMLAVRRRRGAPHAGALLARDVGRRDLRHGDALPAAKTRGSGCAQLRAQDARTSASRCSSAAPTPSATRTTPTTSSPAS